jgi:hypothetical protein
MAPVSLNKVPPAADGPYSIRVHSTGELSVGHYRVRQHGVTSANNRGFALRFATLQSAAFMHPINRHWSQRNRASPAGRPYDPGKRAAGSTSAVPKRIARPSAIAAAGGGAILDRRARAVLGWRTRLRGGARTSSFVALTTPLMFYFGGVIFRITPFLSLPAADLRIRRDSQHQQARD